MMLPLTSCGAAAAIVMVRTGGEEGVRMKPFCKAKAGVITMLPAGEHVRDVWLHQGGLIEAVIDVFYERAVRRGEALKR